MSLQYDVYLNNHKENVYRGFHWLRDNIREVIPDDLCWKIEFSISYHAVEVK